MMVVTLITVSDVMFCAVCVCTTVACVMYDVRFMVYDVCGSVEFMCNELNANYIKHGTLHNVRCAMFEGWWPTR